MPDHLNEGMCVRDVFAMTMPQGKHVFIRIRTSARHLKYLQQKQTHKIWHPLYPKNPAKYKINIKQNPRMRKKEVNKNNNNLAYETTL